MPYDAICALYQGSHINGSLLEVISIKSFNINYVLFGFLGDATYTVEGLLPEQMGNFIAGNRIDLYEYRDVLASPYTAGAIEAHVRDSTRFADGDNILLTNDGISFNVVGTVSNIIGGNILITGTSSASASYPTGATVMTLAHRGKLSSIMTDDDLQRVQGFTSTSYFNDLNSKVVNETIQSTSTVGYEAIYCIYSVINKYVTAGELPDLVLNPLNFAMTSNPNGSPFPTLQYPNVGSGIGYSGTNSATPIMTFIQDAITQANGGSIAEPPVLYTMGITLNNVLFCQPINQTTPTVNLFLNSYTPSTQNDGLFDCVIEHKMEDQQLANIFNVLIGSGGNDALGNPILTTMTDTASVSAFGQRENYVTNSNCNTLLSLQNWLQGQLNICAWPPQSFTTTIYPSLTRITPNDFVCVGFNSAYPNT
jgi:hypothetical protein